MILAILPLAKVMLSQMVPKLTQLLGMQVVIITSTSCFVLGRLSKSYERASKLTTLQLLFRKWSRAFHKSSREEACHNWWIFPASYACPCHASKTTRGDRNARRYTICPPLLYVIQSRIQSSVDVYWTQMCEFVLTSFLCSFYYCSSGTRLSGMRQRDLIQWYVAQQNEKNNYSSMEEAAAEVSKIKAIIEVHILFLKLQTIC